jgi:hypothetical protein
MPSIIEAWFKVSEITASSGPSSVSNSPPLASKQEVYRIVSSVCRNSEIFRSSDKIGMVRQPQIIIGAEIQYGSIADKDFSTLWGLDYPFILE